MHYYKRNIGDYSTKAGHLSALEHGVYTLLLDSYYNRERGPTKAEAIRWARARTPDELAAVDAVLSEFFTEADGVYVQSRVEQELSTYRANAETNRRTALHRESTKRARIVVGSLQDREPNQEPRTTNQEPQDQKLSSLRSDSESPEGDPKREQLDPIVGKVLEAYHEVLPKCLQVAVVNPKRKKRIVAADKLARSVCKRQGWEYDTAVFWGEYFRDCSRDAWMRGEVPNPNNPNWKQNIDVLLAEDRFAGIMDRALESMRDGA